MKLKLLPSYTTERYYILSEIEERADFELLEETEGFIMTLVKVIFIYLSISLFNLFLITINAQGGAQEGRNTANDQGKSGFSTCNAFYLLWDLRDGSSKSDDSFMADVTKLLPKILELKSVLARSICCIEIVISKESCWKSRGLEKLVHNVIKWMDNSCGFGCIYVGICDSVGGAPALEAILDYAKIIEDHNLHSTIIQREKIKLRVVASSATEMLGHDPSREPDAVSGVYQAEYIHSKLGASALNYGDSLSKVDLITGATVGEFSDDLNISQWAESVGLEHSKIPRDVNGQRGSNVGDMKGDFWRRTTSLVVVISICVAAYLFQLQSRAII